MSFKEFMAADLLQAALIKNKKKHYPDNRVQMENVCFHVLHSQTLK